MFGGVFLTATCIYGTLLYRSYQREVVQSKRRHVPEDVSDRYDKTAEHFDQDVDLTEKLMGLNRLRKKLCKEARGHVLEVSVGTGRNMEWYPLSRMKSLTAVDQSPQMIAVARRKWEKTGGTRGQKQRLAVRLEAQSALERIACPDPEGFDTVIQTMGLCSTPEPERLLRNLGKMAKAGKAGYCCWSTGGATTTG